jgi:putative flippase GtrA
MTRHKASISWFTIIGALAALVHYITAVSLESLSWLSAADANIAGFMAAFPVSYFGHRFLSFAHLNAKHRDALPRFFGVALLGFIANQSLVLTGLAYTPLPFWLVLGFVMLIVAVSTYLLSHFWAFKG